jgi:predicted GIY-YIG superfamily endonuclease
MDRQFYVYILASRKHGTLYIGVTNDLVRRVAQHKAKLIPGFTTKHGVDKLMYYEIFDDPSSAIARENSRSGIVSGRSEPSNMTIRIGTTCLSISKPTVTVDSGTRGLRPLGRNDVDGFVP